MTYTFSNVGGMTSALSVSVASGTSNSVVVRTGSTANIKSSDLAKELIVDETYNKAHIRGDVDTPIRIRVA